MNLTDTEVAALVISVKTAVFSLLCILPVGIGIGWLLAKVAFRGKSVLNTLVMLPLVLPPVVSGYLLLMLFSRQGPIGAILYRLFGLEIVFSLLAVVLAISVISFPLMVRSIAIAMEGVNPRLEGAARTLGAGRFKVFFFSHAPVVLPRNYRGRNSGFRQKSRRIRRHYDDSRQHTRQNTDATFSDLQLCTDGGRNQRLSAGVFIDGYCFWRAVACGKALSQVRLIDLADDKGS
jgi:hypothetical protein